MRSTSIPLPALGVLAMSFACGPGGGSDDDTVEGEWFLRTVLQESDPDYESTYPNEYQDPDTGCDVTQGQSLIVDGDTVENVIYYQLANCDDPAKNGTESYSYQGEFNDVGDGRYEIPNDDGDVTLCVFSGDELDCAIVLEACKGEGNCEPFDTIHLIYKRD